MNSHFRHHVMRSPLTIALLASLLASPLIGQTDKTLQSKIVSAIVFNDRALVTRTATGNFGPGKYNLKIAGLPLLMNDQSVRVSGKGSSKAKILEVRTEVARLDSVPDAVVKGLQNKLKAVEGEIRKVNDRGAALSQQRDFLGRISIASAENISKDLRVQRPTVDDWQKVLSFLDANTTRLNADQRELDSKKEQLKESENEIQFDLRDAGTSQQPREEQVFVALDVANEGNLNLEVSYLVQNASWQPIYDLRTATDEKKIELTYNALVWQNTGEDWKDVTLTLSTAQPVMGGSQPTLSPWFIDVYGGTKGAIQGFVRDIATGEPLPLVNVVIEGRGQGATTNSDGFFLIQNVEPGDYSLRASLLGYRTQTLRIQVVPYQTARVDASLESTQIQAEGLTVTAERPLVNVSKTAGMQVLSNDVVPTAFETARLQTGTTSTAFEVGARATIPSNNTKRKVTITVASLAGDFKYSSAPKLQPRVYFKCAVTNSTDFPFLDGTMSVFVDNNYTSNSHMSTVMPGEKFDAFLGVDDGIRIERKTLNRLTESTGFFSKSKKTTYDILIKVENLKKTVDSMTIQDNVPISRNEKILVTVETPRPEELQPDAEGLLRWNMELKAGEKRDIHLKYSIEYPTDFTVSALE